MVLSCEWSGNSAKPECTLLPGYQMQHYDTKVRILITSVHKSHEGRYSCQILGMEPKDISGCELKVEGIERYVHYNNVARSEYCVFD